MASSATLSASTFKGEKKLLPVEELILSKDLQCRDDLEEVKLMSKDVAEAVIAKEDIEPIPVIRIPQGTKRVIDDAPILPGYYPCDGNRRIMGYKSAGRAKIECIVRDGTWEDAVDVAVSANIKNLAMPRKPADKKNAVLNSLVNHWEYSDRWHADHVQVSHGLVSKTRPEAEKLYKMYSDLKPKPVEGEESKNGKPGTRLDKRGRRQAAKKKPGKKVEKKLIAWDSWESHFGWIARFIDHVGEVSGTDSKAAGSEFQKAHAALKAHGIVMKRWCEKLKAKK